MGLFTDELVEIATRVADLNRQKAAASLGDTLIQNFSTTQHGWLPEPEEGDTRLLDVSFTRYGLRVRVGNIGGPMDVADLVAWISAHADHTFKRTGDAVKKEYEPGMTWEWNDRAVILDASWSGPTAKCRMVKTGTRFVESRTEDVFEMVCDDDVKAAS